MHVQTQLDSAPVWPGSRGEGRKGGMDELGEGWASSWTFLAEGCQSCQSPSSALESFLVKQMMNQELFWKAHQKQV